MRPAMAVAVWAGALSACSRPVDQLYAQPLESPSYSNPLVTRDLVIFGSDEGGVYAYTKDGARKWAFSRNLRQVYSGPDWDGDNLVFFGATNQMVYALTVDQGREVWAYRTQDRVKGDPTYWNGLVIIGSYDKHLYALEAKTGKPRWIFPPHRRAPAPSAAKGRAPPPPPPADPSEERVVPTGEFSYAKPLVVNGVVYVGNLDGHLYAIDAATGEMRWRFRTGKGTESAGVGVTSTAAHSNGVLFFGSSDHNVYALGEDAQVRWVFQTGDSVLASPKVDQGTVYVGSVDKTLYALDEKTGALKWKLAGDGPFISSPALHGRHLVQCGGAGDGAIRLLEKDTGEVLWSKKTDRKIESDPAVVGDAVFITGGDGRLYAFRINAK